MAPRERLLWAAPLAPSLTLVALSLAGVRQVWLMLPLAVTALAILAYLGQRQLWALEPLGRWARLALAVTLGLVALILLAFPLALLPGGLGTVGWSVSIALFTLVALLGPVPLTPGHLRRWGWLRGMWGPVAEPLAALALAGVAVVLALRLASAGAVAAPFSGFTLLWMLPRDPAGMHFQVGVRNVEQMPVSYRMLVRLDGARLYEWPDLAFDPLEAREYDVPLPEESRAGRHLEVLLYRRDAPDQVYRRVEYWRAPTTPAP